MRTPMPRCTIEVKCGGGKRLYGGLVDSNGFPGIIFLNSSHVKKLNDIKKGILCGMCPAFFFGFAWPFETLHEISEHYASK